MRIDFVNEISHILDIKRKDMIEKDVILHQILTDLSKDNFFSKNFIFKGGTCLVKSYLGYYRFSVDIDFTWKDQNVFDEKSMKRVRAQLSKVIDKTGKIFEKIAVKRGLDFKCVKSNPKYVELGGSNKTCTFKIWYELEVFDIQSFLKAQFNFVEKVCFDEKKSKLKSMLTKKHDELVIYSEYNE